MVCVIYAVMLLYTAHDLKDSWLSGGQLILQTTLGRKILMALNLRLFQTALTLKPVTTL